MNAANIAVALSIAALLLGAGPLLDEAGDAELQAADVRDAQQQAQAAADMQRWARHHCRNAHAVTLYAEGDAIACLDAHGQRVASIAATKP